MVTYPKTLKGDSIMTIEEYTEMSIRESLKVGELALKASKDRQAQGVDYQPPKSNAIYKATNDSRIVAMVVCGTMVALIILIICAIATKQF